LVEQVGRLVEQPCGGQHLGPVQQAHPFPIAVRVVGGHAGQRRRQVTAQVEQIAEVVLGDGDQVAQTLPPPDGQGLGGVGLGRVEAAGGDVQQPPVDQSAAQVLVGAPGGVGPQVVYRFVEVGEGLVRS